MPEIVVEQRMRNHLIRYLEMASDEVELLDYQRNAPIANVLGELINQFEDYFDIEHIGDWYGEPVYAKEEIQACLRFHKIWDMVDFLPDNIESIGEFLASEYWPPFRDEAKKALLVFRKRGFFSDEEPEFNKPMQPTAKAPAD